MRALCRAAAALPAFSRRSRSRRRGRCSESSLSGSRRPSRGGAASRSSFRAVPGLRPGAARALAGAFVLLALGVLVAPPAEAQTAVEYLPFPDLLGSTSVPEGTTLVFRVRLYDRSSFTLVGAPPGGLTVNLTVSDTTTAGADFLAPTSEGAKTVTFKEGESVVRYSVPTVDDNQDEPNGQVEMTLVAGDGYSLGVTGTTVQATIQDNEI